MRLDKQASRALGLIKCGLLLAIEFSEDIEGTEES